jgi:predicted nucleotidyltransferase
MSNWEKAVEKFIKPWRAKKNVIAALVAGSYVTGKPNPRSDLDVYIVTKPGTRWRERGNKRIDGFLVEYFVNPPEQIRKYFADNHAHNSAMSLTPYTSGRVLFDKNGTLARLRREANRWLGKPMKRPSKSD